ncbi:copper homeostasis protein CutC [Hymenobacter caeli]|uniref:Copper homeostasis protein CutC n=1 Tax=Hymenobacter caeli TaxID=2735894 RepID=A0ABX2FTD6_9BACT|nr:copper homeostasis protein CutC [Hymenobacter caeli]NRT20446.1 copper homeostasis protein CutC [Hymenobacter caeli]
MSQQLEICAGRICVRPGAGITAANIQALAARTGARELHASAKRLRPPEAGAGLFAAPQFETDAALVAELVALLNHRQHGRCTPAR